MRFVTGIKGCFYLFFKSNLKFVKTLYINFRMFPFHIACKLSVYVYGKWKFVELEGTFEIKAPVKREMILMGMNIADYMVTPSGSLRKKKGSQIIFQEKNSIITRLSDLFE